MLSVLRQPPSCSLHHGLSFPGNHSSWCQGIEDVFRWVFAFWGFMIYTSLLKIWNLVYLSDLNLPDLYYVLFSKILILVAFRKSAVFLWNSGSPSHINSAWLLNSRTPPRGARRNSETDAMDTILHRNSLFHLPGLPEDTLMEVEPLTTSICLATIVKTKRIELHLTSHFGVFFINKEAHVDALSDLRFTLAFVHCIMELASSKDPELEACSSDISFLQKSLVTDQISLLSKEWRWEWVSQHFWLFFSFQTTVTICYVAALQNS